MVSSSDISALIQLNVNTLLELKLVLSRLDGSSYTTYNVNGQATIGQHVRHALEFFDCLFEGSGEVNYDARKRNSTIERDLAFAIESIDRVLGRVELIDADCELTLITELSIVSKLPLKISSSLGRELFYVLEHAIHHMALMRMMLKDIDAEFELPESFGVAYSTLAHRANS